MIVYNDKTAVFVIFIIEITKCEDFHVKHLEE